jgi:hypothetical protein
VLKNGGVAKTPKMPTPVAKPTMAELLAPKTQAAATPVKAPAPAVSKAKPKP